MVKDVIKCFICAVTGVEKTFNSYYELQEHIYRDHDVRKDPAMESFNRSKTKTGPTPASQ